MSGPEQTSATDAESALEQLKASEHHWVFSYLHWGGYHGNQCHLRRLPRLRGLLGYLGHLDLLQIKSDCANAPSTAMVLNKLRNKKQPAPWATPTESNGPSDANVPDQPGSRDRAYGAYAALAFVHNTENENLALASHILWSGTCKPQNSRNIDQDAAVKHLCKTNCCNSLVHSSTCRCHSRLSSVECRVWSVKCGVRIANW